MQDRRTIAELYVLLVEPSRAQTRIIVEQLESLGLTDYSTVTTGVEALASAANALPDLVLSAMYLPDMSGTDLLLALRSAPESGDVGFMLVSSESSIDALRPIRQAGASAILPKPFRAQHLARALAACLDVLDPARLALPQATLESLRVLVVDDSGFSRRFVRNTLANMGIRDIVEAGDGLEAIERVDNEFFDLVVTDYVMPRADGRALVEHIREHSSQPTLPVLMVTSEGDAGRLAAVQQAGVSAILDKPFEAAAVKSLIETALAA